MQADQFKKFAARAQDDGVVFFHSGRLDQDEGGRTFLFLKALI